MPGAVLADFAPLGASVTLLSAQVAAESSNAGARLLKALGVKGDEEQCEAPATSFMAIVWR